MRDREFGQQIVEFGLAAVAVRLHHFEHGADILLDRHAPEDRGFLRQISDTAPGAAIHRQAGDILAIKLDRTVIGLDEPGNHVKDGGFARPVGAEQADGLAALNMEADVAHHGAALEALADLDDLEPRIVGYEMRHAVIRLRLAPLCAHIARHRIPTSIWP